MRVEEYAVSLNQFFLPNLGFTYLHLLVVPALHRYFRCLVRDNPVKELLLLFIL
jgi:hypothetical protein